VTWLDPLRAQLDRLTGRFVASYAITTEEREGVYALLDEVRRTDRQHTKASLEGAALADREGHDTLTFVRDLRNGGRMIGVARSTLAADLPGSPTATQAYALDVFSRADLANAGVVTHIALLKPYRKTAALLALLQHLYEEGLAAGYVWWLLSCEPSAVALYRRLGFRTVASVHGAIGGGFRIPMVLVAHDEAHLSLVGSPMLPALRKLPHPLPPRGPRWVREFQAANLTLDVGVEPLRIGELPETLVEGVSLAGQVALADHGLVLACEFGQRVIVQDEGSRTLGVVIAGAAEVVADGRTVARLETGEMFGELSLILGSRRTADVVAATPNTRVAMLSHEAIDRVRLPADRELVWRNLARIVARRLLHLRDAR
jgi:hypothetical protein